MAPVLCEMPLQSEAESRTQTAPVSFSSAARVCRFRQNPEVVATVIQDCHPMLVHFPTHATYRVSRLGLRIWRRLKEGCTTDEIVDLLARETTADWRMARKLASRMVVKLLQRNLVTATVESN